MSFPILETERLRLVEITEDYAPAMFDIFSREDVTRYYGMIPFVEEEQAQKMVQSFAMNFEAKRGIRWGMQWKESGEYVGSVGLNNLVLAGKRAEVGYELHPKFWRKGIVSEAVKAVLQYSFQELDLHRIGAVTFPENEASSNLLLKLGFLKEGLLRGYIYQGGVSYDANVFSILKTDWVKILSDTQKRLN
ncbi:GNAT family N-acetyltransferase [Heyndrickxia camelliae]|uniref:GNAT family N-acetyltransferase n=1 Tax=Heyndrickxia camelliae TaxID=1707093 RepID=A0A2N3LI86_9BACI|nr:GNAT family N-acetyltransferase [Heyndrickxia camelliae]PKR84243.1 GNAT family N-acetyltransferase [Heyndrickxia camelliae]